MTSQLSGVGFPRKFVPTFLIPLKLFDNVVFEALKDWRMDAKIFCRPNESAAQRAAVVPGPSDSVDAGLADVVPTGLNADDGDGQTADRTFSRLQLVGELERFEVNSGRRLLLGTFPVVTPQLGFWGEGIGPCGGLRENGVSVHFSNLIIP